MSTEKACYVECQEFLPQEINLVRVWPSNKTLPTTPIKILFASGGATFVYSFALAVMVTMELFNFEPWWGFKQNWALAISLAVTTGFVLALAFCLAIAYRNGEWDCSIQTPGRSHRTGAKSKSKKSCRTTSTRPPACPEEGTPAWYRRQGSPAFVVREMLYLFFPQFLAALFLMGATIVNNRGPDMDGTIVITWLAGATSANDNFSVPANVMELSVFSSGAVIFLATFIATTSKYWKFNERVHINDCMIPDED